MDEMKEKFIDAHAHLDDERFAPDLDEVIGRAKAAGLKAIITVGCWRREGGIAKALDIAGRHPMVRLAAGVHPHDAKEVTDNSPYELLKGLAAEGKLVAIGECGLDFYYKNSPAAAQRKIFAEQIRLAGELSLPLIVHSREAGDETLAMLDSEGAGGTGGVIHCFSGSAEMAGKALSMGLYLSFTGVVTFPRADELREVVRSVPTERMLIETDCPYLAPAPMRGRRCEPAFVVETARKIAELKGLSLADMARITTLNAETLFGMGEAKEPRPGEAAKIAYRIRNSLYLNITNRCTNRCTFCAKFSSYTVKGHYLKLEREPDLAEVLKAIGPNPETYDEVVFCGFGEPLIRLDLVRELGMRLKKMGCRVRIDTDGLANLVHGGNVLKELMFVDTISVSLNAQDARTYERLCRTPYGEKAYPAILYFLREAKKYIPRVVATVVAVPGVVDVEACRRVAEEDIGVGFRVREYNEVG